MRKVYVNVKVRLIININEGVAVDDVINDMDYGFTFNGNEAEIIDTEVIDFDIIDSK